MGDGGVCKALFQHIIQILILLGVNDLRTAGCIILLVKKLVLDHVTIWKTRLTFSLDVILILLRIFVSISILIGV